MTSPPPSAVPRQVARVRRRLLLHSAADLLCRCWAAALALAAVWFLLQPLLLSEPTGWLRWGVAGGMAVAATGLAVGLALRRAPSDVAAALEIDRRFGLRERVTTAVTLSA